MSIEAQMVAGHYARNITCGVADIYTDMVTTWTTPPTILRTDIVHFDLRAAGAGGCQYQGAGGDGGRVKFDLTNLPAGVVFHIKVGGAGRGSQSLRHGALAGGHSYIKYQDPNTAGNPWRIYSANGGKPDNASGGGNGGQGCDDASGGCSLPIDQDPHGDPNLIPCSFLPEGGGDGGPALANGNAMSCSGQNSRNGAGSFGAGGGSVGGGNAGDPYGEWGFDGYQGLVTVEIKAGI